MRKGLSVTPFLLGTKLFLITCLLIGNMFIVCEAKSRNNKGEAEMLEKRALAEWGSVNLPECWEKEGACGDTIAFVLADNSTSLKFYKVEGAATSKEMKAFLQKRAKSLKIPTFYRTISDDHLEDINAENGGFMQGTVLMQAPQHSFTQLDTIDTNADTLKILTDSLATEEIVADNMAIKGHETEKEGAGVKYFVVAGLQGKKGVFILEAETTNLEEVPMGITRAQRSWMLR